MKTNQGTPSVDSFSNLVKTNDADAWWLGTKKSTTAMVRTPRMCHQALTSDRKATSRTPKLLRSPCAMSTQPYTVRIQPVLSGKFVVRFKKSVKKVANPKSMPAVMATCPKRLNQPVNQLQAAELFSASLDDQ